MKTELSTGMYARTNKGHIIKIIHDFDSQLCGYKIEEITKLSFNIIDLIEVGDILKIHLYDETFAIVEVEKLSYDSGEEYIGVYIPWGEGSEFEELKDLKIVEALTHEFFDANVYRIGE